MPQHEEVDLLRESVCLEYLDELSERSLIRDSDGPRDLAFEFRSPLRILVLPRQERTDGDDDVRYYECHMVSSLCV